MNQINFYAGEQKLIVLTVRPINPKEIVVVTKADYELIKQYDEIAEKGTCEINGDEVAVLLKVTENGRYTLKVTMNIGREIRIEKIQINVDN